MKNPQITVERLRELLVYDQTTGVFTWKRSKGKIAAGSIAGAHQKTVAFCAYITGHDGKRISLGTYPTAEEAHAVYVEYAEKMRGEFASPR
jgi:hypothetical protein